MDFVSVKIDNQVYVYVLTIEVNGENIMDQEGHIICYKMTNQPYTGSQLNKINQYNLGSGIFSCLRKFKDQYLICASEKVCIFDISDPEEISHKLTKPLNDLCIDLHQLGDDRIVFSYATPNSHIYKLEINDANFGAISLKPSNMDYNWESGGIMYPYDKNKYFMAERDGMIRLNEINLEPRNDDEKFRVYTKGRFHIHTLTTYMIWGYLKKEQDILLTNEELDYDEINESSYIMGSSCGHISTLQNIPHNIFKHLDMLDMQLKKTFKGFAEFSNLNFRMNEPNDDPYEKLELLECHKLSKRFIDGDFIGMYNSLDHIQQEKIVDSINSAGDEDSQNLNLTAEYYQKLIQSLTVV